MKGIEKLKVVHHDGREMEVTKVWWDIISLSTYDIRNDDGVILKTIPNGGWSIAEKAARKEPVESEAIIKKTRARKKA
jgi:hypothetical protein